MPDEDGQTAWMLANFAPTVTLVACQPGALTAERYPLLPPYVRRLAYLLKAKANPIVSIVHDLEAAGAESKPDEAKRAWLQACPNASPELRQALAQGELLPTLIGDSLARQLAFNKTANENPRKLPITPPPEMQFLQGKSSKHHGRESPLLQISGMRCEYMAKPEMPAINWSGEILFRAVVATRAGVVETADFAVLSGSKERRVADLFRSVIVRALAKYRCEGDHIFEQQFQFTIR